MTDYYVDFDKNKGDDNNDGSKDSPFRTLARAQDAITNNNDRILFYATAKSDDWHWIHGMAEYW